jgi:hypothetical protein
MSEPKRAYFIAGGRALEAILKWDSEYKAAQKAYGEFFEKTGINYAHAQRGGHRFTCEGDAQPKGPGFRLEKGCRSSWVFDRKAPEGKALAKEWGTLHFPRFGDRNIGASSVIGGFHMYHTVPEMVGDVWVLNCPYFDKMPEPYDSTPIKTSEYWAMKETAEPAQAEA